MTTSTYDDVEHGGPDPSVRSAPEEDGNSTTSTTRSHSPCPPPPPAQNESTTTTTTTTTQQHCGANRNDLEAATAVEQEDIQGLEEEEDARSSDVEEGLDTISDTNDNHTAPTVTTSTDIDTTTRSANVPTIPLSPPPDDDENDDDVEQGFQQQRPPQPTSTTSMVVDMNDFRLRHYLFEESAEDGADDPENNSLSSSLLLDGDNNNGDSINPGCDRCLDITGRLVCIPIALVVTVTTVTTVLAFCVLPSLLLIGTALTLYYCCTREPVPVRVLLRAMLLDENDPTAASMLNGAEMAAPRFTKAEIQPYLLRRTCIAIHNHSDDHNDDDNTNSSSDKPSPHQVGDVPDGGLVVETADGKLYFSGPLTSEASTSSSDPDDDNEEQQSQLPHHNNPDTDSNNNSILLLDTPEQAQEIELVDIPIRVPQVETTDDIDSAVGRVPLELEETKEEEDHRDAQTSTLSATHHHNTNDPLHTMNGNNHDNDHSGCSPEEDVTDAHHERGTACDICLRRYRVGDTLAWSRNPVCNHAFHADCITDWLLHQQQQQSHQRNRHDNNNNNNNSCPNCRADFLYADPMAQRRKSASSRRSSRGSGNHHRLVDEPDLNNDNNNPVVVPPV